MAKRGRPRKDVKKYIMRQTMHLGYIRETLGAGTVIEHDENNDHLIVDGRVFENTKDLVILKKHNWIAEYSKENKQEVLEEQKVKEEQKVPEPKNSTKNTDNQKMKVIKSDEDIIEAIDISHTKPKKPEEKKSNQEEMEIIKADETAQERLDRLQSTIPDMEVVGEDDGFEVDAVDAPSLNEGQNPPIKKAVVLNK